MKEAPYPSMPVIVVDDEAQALTSYDAALRYGGFDNIITCRDSREVIPFLMGQSAEVLILDLLMPHLGGEEVLREVSREFPQIPVIVVTGVDDVETAVRCMKTGAFDYLVKPMDNDRLVTTVARAIAYQELQRENRSLKKSLLARDLQRPEAFSGIITQDPGMHAVFRYVEAIATSSKPVLITGETGVGKELIARALHRLSSRPGHFVAANVAGLDDDFFSDTLFGHAKGSFTGADRRRSGLIEKAAGGTLLLDEIGDLSPVSQMKMLRFLQENEYLPLGEDMPRKADARIVASTNRDIRVLQEGDRFRRDLFYRLRTHHIRIPPLRERQKDIPLLVDHFLGKAAQSLGKEKTVPHPDLVLLMEGHDFPGNVRELEAMIFDAVGRHGGGMLGPDTFKTYIVHGPVRNEKGEAADRADSGTAMVFPQRLPSIREMTRLLVDEALRRAKGNIAMAAGFLGISHQALRKRLKRGGHPDA